MKLFLLSLFVIGYAVADMNKDEIGFDFHYNCNIGLEVPLDGYVSAIKSLFSVPEIAEYLNPEVLSKKIDEVVNGIKSAFDQLKRIPSLDNLLEQGNNAVLDAADKHFDELKAAFSGVKMDELSKILKEFGLNVVVQQVKDAENKAIADASNLSNGVANATNVVSNLPNSLPNSLPNGLPNGDNILDNVGKHLPIPSVPAMTLPPLPSFPW